MYFIGKFYLIIFCLLRRWGSSAAAFNDVAFGLESGLVMNLKSIARGFICKLMLTFSFTDFITSFPLTVFIMFLVEKLNLLIV